MYVYSVYLGLNGSYISTLKADKYITGAEGDIDHFAGSRGGSMGGLLSYAYDDL